jgi:DNA-binding MarR family transcriptional regulator
MVRSKRNLKPSQERVLKHLALEGEDYLNKIAPKIGFTLTRTRNSIKRLTQYKLIWQSKGSQDPKSKEKKFYSLTHYGIVEAFISLLNYEETSRMIENWKMYAPQYVINFNKFREKGILEDLEKILRNLYPKIVKPWDETNYPTDGIDNSILSTQTHIIDTILFFDIFEWNKQNIGNDFQYKFLEIVNQDPIFKERWDRWLSMKKFSLNNLEILSNTIKENQEFYTRSHNLNRYCSR